MEWHDVAPAEESTSVADILRMLRRRVRTIVLVVAVMTGATALFASQLDERYRAVASIVIEPYGSNIIDLAEGGLARPADRGALETHAEALQSPSIILNTMEALDLVGDPEFTVEAGWSDRAADFLLPLLRQAADRLPEDWHYWFGLSTADAGILTEEETFELDPAEADRIEQELAALVFASHLHATWSEGSSVMRVSFSSLYPDRAAAVVNRIVELHVQNQLEARRRSASKAIDWLRKQLPVIQQDVAAAEARIAQFRSQHPLIGGKGGSLAEASLYGVNSALVEARAVLAEKSAKLQIIRRLQATGGNLDALADVIASPLISALRRQEAELAAKTAELATKLEARHPARQALQQEAVKLSAQIEDQIGRIVRSLEHEIAVATAQVQQLGADMQSAKSQNAEYSEAGVQLLELEREAAAKRTLYENLLRRYEEIAGQQGILEPGVRVIAAAEVPAGPHTPSPMLATTVGLAASLVAACLLALLLEQSDKTLRSARQVERLLGVPCLALVPTIKRSMQRRLHKRLGTAAASAYAQSLRTLAVLVTARQRRPGAIVVTSALPQEGKSTLAAALAVSIAQCCDRKVVVVDFDLWRPSLQRELRLHSGPGVSDFLVDGDWSAFDEPDGPKLQRAAQVDVLPAGRRLSQGLQHITDASVRALIDELRARYDLVIIDSPPLLGVNDGRILAMQADSVLVAVRWGKTSRSAAGSVLKALRSVSAPILGIALTRVDTKRQALYGEGDSLQYHREFQRYYGA